MQIGKPVSTKHVLKTKKARGIGLFAPIWERVATLAEGKWLPVQCADLLELRRIQTSANGLGAREFGKLQTRSDSLKFIVYIRKNPDKQPKTEQREAQP